MSDRYDKLRAEYEGAGLDGLTESEPFALFDTWQRDAEAAELPLANAMSLATASADGAPSVRTVLLKNVDERGRLWFFSDYESQKGAELGANPRAEVLFYWQPLHRQIRVRGPVARLDASASDAYFASRPRASSLSAMASHQSAEIADGPRALEDVRAALATKLAEEPLERPARWGGYALSPVRFEFWQGRPDRLHHRLCFEQVGGSWTRLWLSP